MSIKLLPASVNPVDPSQEPDVSTSLVPLSRSAITTRAGQIGSPSADTFTSSSRTRPDRLNWIDAIPVDDSQTDETAQSNAEYVSGWAWNSPVERTAAAHYLLYAAPLAITRGQFINLYA